MESNGLDAYSTVTTTPVNPTTKRTAQLNTISKMNYNYQWGVGQKNDMETN